MRLSKHHYAVALAARGNEVLFLQPPSGRGTEPRREAVEGIAGLEVITWNGPRSLWLRYKARPLYDVLCRHAINALLRALGRAPDILWCFDTNTYSDLGAFRAPLRIYHPVDPVSGRQQRSLARSASVLLSVAPEILASIPHEGTPARVFNHGLSEEYARYARSRVPGARKPGPPRVGFIGSLFKHGFAHAALRRLIDAHTDVEFHIWSPTSLTQSNVAGAASTAGADLIAHLRRCAHVRLHGLLQPHEVARAIQEMDAFLCCDRGNGWNSHKVLEYLSTGKPVFSLPLSMYRGNHLVEMSDTDSDHAFCTLFALGMRDLQRLSGIELQRARIAFALDHTYERQIGRIATFLADRAPAA